MKLDEDIQEYNLADPEDENNTVKLEDKAIDAYDKKHNESLELILALMHHYGASVLAQYEALEVQHRTRRLRQLLQCRRPEYPQHTTMEKQAYVGLGRHRSMLLN